MPFEVESQTVEASEPSKIDEIVLRWRPIAAKIAARKGARGKPEPVITLAGAYDPEQDGDVSEWVRAMAYRIMDSCESDANGRAFRYIVQTFGEGLTPDKRPTIGSPVDVRIDAAPGGESASGETAMLKEVRELLKFMSGEIKQSYGTTRELLETSIKQSTQIGDALVRRDEVRWRIDQEIHDVEVRAKVDIAGLHADMSKTQARWGFAKAFFDAVTPMFRPLFDHIFAQDAAGGDASGAAEGADGADADAPSNAPTADEIRKVFGAHEDLQDLAIGLIEQPRENREPIRAAFLRRYVALPDAEKEAIIKAIYGLPKARVVAIGAWLLAEGIATA